MCRFLCNICVGCVFQKKKMHSQYEHKKSHTEIEKRETNPIIIANTNVKTGVAGWIAAA